MLLAASVVFMLFATMTAGEGGGPSMSHHYDTIVMGCGAAGVTAAATLARAGRRVLAVDAQATIGGRVRTVPFGDGVVELGAEWIHGTHSSRVYELALKHNVSVIPQHLDFRVYRSDGSLADMELLSELVMYCLQVVETPPQRVEPLGQFVTGKLTQYLSEHHPEVLKNKDLLDNFLKFMNLLMNNYEASNDWNDVTVWSKYEDLDGEQHMSWHRYGYKTLFDILLNTYNNGPGLPTLEIKLNTEVTRIVWPQEPAQNVTVECRDGTVYTANTVIVTASVGVLKERHTTLFTPELPEEKRTAIDKISMGLLNKIILSFPNNWWGTKQYWYSFLWKTSDLKAYSDEDAWTKEIGGFSCPMGSSNTVTIWASGEPGKVVRNPKKHRPISRKDMLFSPSLPQEKQLAIDHISMGLVDKIIISFEHVWWPRNAMFFAFVWRTEEWRSMGDQDWETQVFGASCPMGASNALTLWTSGEIAKKIETLPEDVVKRKTMNILRKFMGANITIPEPTGIIRSKWYSNPFTRGSYTYDNLEVSKYPNAREHLAAPLTDSAGKPRVLFAGEATNEIHFATVNGATETGYREAMRLLPAASKI